MSYWNRKTEDAALERETQATQRDEWREIPGYGGAYEIDWDGNVRTWRWRGEHLARHPRLLVAFKRKARGKNRHESNRRYVKLTRPDGTSTDVPVLKIMVDVWLGGPRPGFVPYHINGDLGDSSVRNIGWTTPQKLGKMTGGNSRRIPVAKVTPDGEVVALYKSAREAAKANHMSYQTVLDRCNGKVKKPFALDGHNYIFDE